jgi:photosystem II stability/assembly factor-like uncharacterized protein
VYRDKKDGVGEMRKIKLLFIILIIVLIAENGFSNIWFEDSSGVNVQLNSVICFNEGRAWCCGNDGTVLRTHPQLWQGNTWINVSGNGIPSNINLVNVACSAIDTNIALTTGTINNTTYVYRTTNSGANWVQVFSQLNGYINSIWFTSIVDPANVFMQGNPVGGRWSLWKSTNNGLNWDSSGLYLPQSGTEHGWNNSMYCINGRIWFGTNNSRIYYSTNLGVSWDVQPTSPEMNTYTIVKYYNYPILFAGGATLLKSTNLGVNWIQNTSMGSGNFGGIATSNYGAFWWYVRSDNKIYLTSNNGANWTVENTAPAGNYTNIFLWYNTIFMYAVRSNGGISRYYIMVNVKKLSNEIPEQFSLSQNYPNPFNPTTKIKFSIPPYEGGKGDVSLKVFNVLGKEVATLVNEQLKPGMYEVEFNGDNFASGVYYYKLVAGDFRETKRMVLIK